MPTCGSTIHQALGWQSWSLACRGPARRGRPRVKRGREHIRGSGASRCQSPPAITESTVKARREAEGVVNPQLPKLVINWEGLAPLGTRHHPRGLGIPRGAAPCHPDIPRLLSTCCMPGQRFLAHSGRKKDEQGTRRSAGDSGRRKLSTPPLERLGT